MMKMWVYATKAYFLLEKLSNLGMVVIGWARTEAQPHTVLNAREAGDINSWTLEFL